jgi:tetratricopeptide (TPR) repeat protein
MAMTFINLGAARGRLGDSAGAISAYTSAIELPGATPEQVAKSYFNRSLVYRQLGDNAAAITDFSHVIDLHRAPVEQVAAALVNRGILRGQQGESAAAIADFSQTINLPDAPPMHVANAFHNRGVSYFLVGRKQEAQMDFEAVVNLPNGPGKAVVNAYLALAKLYWSDGRWMDGFSAIEAGLKRGAIEQRPHPETPLVLIDLVFSAGLNAEGRIVIITKLLRLYEQYEALPLLSEALIQHIGDIFRFSKPLPSTDNLEQWAAGWERAAATVPDFSLSLRLLRTGVEFVKSGGKDPGILLTLNAVERAILLQVLGLKEKLEKGGG